jgi:FMN phosphatase YigB (HAD superfamily)
MLSALYPDVRWEQIRCVGFDLDGTLYDEYEFIDQAYEAVLLNSVDLLEDKAGAGVWMRNRWLEKGSSYPKIFGEAFARFGKPDRNPDAFVQRALQAFRNFHPRLTLPARNQRLLDELRGRYRLFLVSDGNPQLQRRKFDALGLARFFDADDCMFTGAQGPGWEKPSVRSLEKLSLGQFAPEEIVFFGDRERDRAYAAAAQLSYVHVYNLIGR